MGFWRASDKPADGQRSRDCTHELGRYKTCGICRVNPAKCVGEAAGNRYRRISERRGSREPVGRRNIKPDHVGNGVGSPTERAQNGSDQSKGRHPFGEPLGAARSCVARKLEPVLREHQMPVAQLVDLGFGGCRMSVAVKSTSGYSCAADLPPHCRVASKFTNCARSFFDDLDLPVELVHLTGSVELGPITGIAEAIVDLVATGRTLRDNGLIEIETLFQSTARLVGNPLALRLDRGELLPIIEAIRPKETSQ